MKEIKQDFFSAETENSTKIEDKLYKYESIIWRGCPKRKSYAMGKTLGLFPIALIWGFIDFGVIFMMSSLGAFSDNPEMLLFIIPFFALHLMPVWIWIGSTVKASKEMKNTFYFITSSRFIMSKGKEDIIVTDIKIEDIKDVTLHRDIIDKILKVGDISVISAKKTLVLNDIPNAEFMYSKIKSIAMDNEANGNVFKNQVICDHCGSSYDVSNTKCPYCGASKPSKV